MQRAENEVLLHCCCAPCSSAIIEWMLAHDVRPTLYYFNPNIFPEEEYLIRKNECTCYAASLDLDIIDDDYDHEAWRCQVKGMEMEPERGARCLQCFKMRLLHAARKAVELGFGVLFQRVGYLAAQKGVALFFRRRRRAKRSASTIETGARAVCNSVATNCSRRTVSITSSIADANSAWRL